MKQPMLHPVEVSILRTLRRSVSARFSALMKPTGLNSDSFKFYVRRLIELGYVQKDPLGRYTLTNKGKEFANNLDESALMIQKQPKVSVIIKVREPIKHKEEPARFLFQQRLRQPFYGFYGLISGPVPWGVSFEEAAGHELTKQTGLTASFTVKGFYRQRDYGELLLEDKLLVVVEARNTGGELTNTWSGGNNKWMTVEEYRKQERRFPATDAVFDSTAAGIEYSPIETSFLPDNY